MNDRKLAITLSLTLHGVALLLLYAFGSTAASPPQPIVIDFTLAGREPPGNSKAAPGSAHPGSGPLAPRPASPAPHRQPLSAIAPTYAPEPAKRIVPPRVLQSAGPVVASDAPKSVSASTADSIGRSSVGISAVSGGGGQGKSTGTGLGGGAGTGNGMGMGGKAGSGTGTGSGGDQSGEQLRSKYRSEHFAYIRRIIQENITYPPQARRMQWGGSCKFSFVVLENGQVADIRILKGTGHAVLDENVVETIKRVAPFPRPPVSVKLVIPFTYNID